MEWYLWLIALFFSLMAVIATGIPIAIGFMFLNTIGACVFWGPTTGLQHLAHSIQVAVSSFVLLPVPLFIMMGEIMFLSGLAPETIKTVDKWMGRIPGRLVLLAVGGGTLLATFTGATTASAAVLGSVLAPEMDKRGYKEVMTLGPILAGGLLAPMIPPSALAILICAIGEISVGKVLLAIIFPGLLMGAFYCSYIVIRCYLQPSIAPVYDIPSVSILERLVAGARDVLPVGLIVFAVVGLIFIGVATPTESAAMGVLACAIVTACRRRLNWKLIKDSTMNTLRISVMLVLIIGGGMFFSQILSYSGAGHGLGKWVTQVPAPPILLIAVMILGIIFLGLFMDAASIMMITLPIFLPLVKLFGYDPAWFAVLFLISVEVGLLTPPFGLLLFVMKGVTSADTTIEDIVRASLPFLILSLITTALILAFPEIALFLPEQMR